MRIIRTLKKITIEPVMFLQQAADTITFVIYQNLFIDKICRVDLGHAAKLCDIYEASTNNSEYQFLSQMTIEIQTASSQFSMYNSLVESIFPVFLVLFLGVWSDQKRRRKPTLILSLSGKLIRTIGLFLNAYFSHWPSFVLLLTAAFPHGLGGGNAVFQMSAFSYIADSTSPRSRTWRIGVAEGFWFLGTPIGLFLGQYLFEVGGYLCVFGASFVFHLVGVLFAIFFLPEVPPPRSNSKTIAENLKFGSYGTYDSPIKVMLRSHSEGEISKGETSLPAIFYGNENRSPEESQNLLKPSRKEILSDGESESEGNDEGYELISGSIRAILQPRPNHLRKCLLALGAVMLLYTTAHHGESSMKYLFTRNKFSWREEQFSNWTIFESTATLVGLIIVVPLFSKGLKLSDALGGTIGAITRLSSRLCYALAPESKFMYIGSALDMSGPVIGLNTRSLASKCVARTERGRVFAFLGCIEALVPLFAVPLFSLIYTNTLTYLPSAIYFTSTAIYILILVIFGIIFIGFKLGAIKFTHEDQTHQPGQMSSSTHSINNNNDMASKTEKAFSTAVDAEKPFSRKSFSGACS